MKIPKPSVNMLIVGIIALALLISVAGIAANALIVNEQDCVVKDKESVSDGSGHQYRIYTENCGTLSVGDDIFRMKFNSADIYGDIDAGESYRFTTSGTRVPIFSFFPNVIEAELIN